MPTLDEALDVLHAVGRSDCAALIRDLQMRLREVTSEWESCLERDRAHRQEMQDVQDVQDVQAQGQQHADNLRTFWKQRADEAEADVRRLEDTLTVRENSLTSLTRLLAEQHDTTRRLEDKLSDVRAGLAKAERHVERLDAETRRLRAALMCPECGSTRVECDRCAARWDSADPPDPA